MSKNPFIILGVDERTVNQSELYDAYREKRSKYEEDRFLEGEAGDNAARKISEIDQAYDDAREILNSRATFSDGKVSYHDIEEAIKSKRLDDAQRMLDGVVKRDAEWHFLQSVVYYKKGWINESRIQLQKAVELDPNNAKYRAELDKMNAGNAYSNQNNYYQANNTYGQGAYRSYSSQRPTSDGFCNICSTLCALDCCCECMGGDCIPCC